jgi:hypothetical protein
MAHVVSAWAKDAILTVLVIARWREAAEKAAAEQQDKEEGREKLADAAWRKGAEKAPALAEPWGGPGTEYDTCHDAKATCVTHVAMPRPLVCGVMATPSGSRRVSVVGAGKPAARSGGLRTHRVGS